MPAVVRIGNACGFLGDRLGAAAEMLALDPGLDFITLDFLAEVSMSILALQRLRDPQAGWPRDFLEIIRSLVPYWRNGGRCRLITNAGGLDPMSCARACFDVLQSAGLSDRAIAVVSGDDVLDLIRPCPIRPDEDDPLLRSLDTGASIATVRSRLLTANAYLGARPIADALARGADLVIAGRVADPSLTVAACAHAFGWPWDAWDKLAGATIAGHLIECGTQVTGGISTDWLDQPYVDRIGFPIVEVAEDGSCVVTKPRGTGGRVTEQTVKEQLLYEIADPDAYLSPDVTLSLLSLRVEDEGSDRVRLHGARGRPTPLTYKVGATYQDGFRAQGQLTVCGPAAVLKAQRAAQAVLQRLSDGGVSLRESLVECLGAGACRPQGIDASISGQLQETVLRIAVADDSRDAVEHFAQELMPLVTAGPQGTTGYAEGRPRVHPLFRFWPCLIARERLSPQITMLAAGQGESRRPETGGGTSVSPCGTSVSPACAAGAAVPPIESSVDSGTSATGSASAARENAKNTGKASGTRCSTSNSEIISAEVVPGRPSTLADIAYARSGDKGIHANIGVIARRRADFARLCREVTAARVAAYFGISDAGRVTRYELPNLAAINLVVHGILASPLRLDAQGKALGQVLLAMPLEPGKEETPRPTEDCIFVSGDVSRRDVP